MNLYYYYYCYWPLLVPEESAAAAEGKYCYGKRWRCCSPRRLWLLLMNRKAVKGRFVSQLDCKTFPHSVLSPCCWRIPWNWDRESLVPVDSWWWCPGCLWVVEVGLVQWPVVLKRIRCRRPHHRCHRPPVPRAIYSSASPTLC